MCNKANGRFIFTAFACRKKAVSISELINVPGYINLDFADVTSIMQNAGYAHMGIGTASGKDKAVEAAREAISSPLLETSITGASGVLISITASPDIGLDDIETASSLISSEAAEDATVIWGAAFDESLEDTMKVTIIATGFLNKNEADKTFGKKENLKPIASGKIKSGVNDVKLTKAGEKKKEAEENEDGESPISDDDFNEILKMLNMGKNQGGNQNNQGGFGGFTRRF